jgi:hypothetical protein
MTTIALFPLDRLAWSTMLAVSLTSRLGSMMQPYPSSCSAATFMPMELSPGELVYTGTPPA